jgi:Zn-dependent protease
VILPLATSLLGGGFLGWGRPVNSNPSKLRGGLNGLALVAMAGPASNILFGLVLSALAAAAPSRDLASLAATTIHLSLYLAIFNMIPVPPLDGSKLLLAARIPYAVYQELARFGFLLVLVAMSASNLGRWMDLAAIRGTIWMLGLFGVR